MFIPLHRIIEKKILGKFTAYKLQLKSMPTGTNEFTYHLGSEFFADMESEDIRSGNVEVALTVKNSGQAYKLDFVMKGEIVVGCDRCLDDLPLEVDTTYSLTVKYGEEYSDESDDLLIIPESDTYLNVAYMIYDTVALTIPMKHVHKPGMCNKAMSDTLKRLSREFDDESAEGLDEGEADMPGDDEKEVDPRWAALKNIKENN